jgi:hypothetical protein
MRVRILVQPQTAERHNQLKPMEAKNKFISKLHLVCGNDKDLRKAAQAVHFIGGYAYASDGYIAVKQPLSLSSVIDAENLDNRSIHKSAYEASLKYDFVTANQEGLDCTSLDGSAAFFPYYELDKDIPDYDAVFTGKNLVQASEIGFNGKKVSQLINAMYSSSGQFKLSFTGQGKPIFLESIDEAAEDQVGIIMPVMLQSEMNFKD